jgi:hypothetical protein
VIISHKNRFLFVELPLTASTAISKELRENYGGEKILFKHATYDDFKRVATPDELSYFVFSVIRNPLDKAVSHYFKYKTDHKGQYSNPKQNLGKKILKFWTDRYLHGRRYRFVKEDHAGFPDFFLRFYWLPYSDWSVLSHKSFNNIIRFECLQDDFAKTLRMIGVEPVRPLPSRNQTAEKEKTFVEYYPPEIVPRAKRVFGPYMRYWGYEFPENWGPCKVSAFDSLFYQTVTFFRKVYWRNVRNRV